MLLGTAGGVRKVKLTRIKGENCRIANNVKLKWMIQVSFLLNLAIAASSLACYECDNCLEDMMYLNNVVKECPDRSYVSCLRTESRFAHHTSE